MLVGLTAGWQSDEILVDFKNFKLSTDRIVGIFMEFNKDRVLLWCCQWILAGFFEKVYCEACCGGE